MYAHNAYACTCLVHIHAHTYTCTHQYKLINMDTHIHETMRYSVYCSKFHPNKIHTYRLTYCFPLHFFSNILSVVFIEFFSKVDLFKLLGNLIPSLDRIVRSPDRIVRSVVGYN